MKAIYLAVLLACIAGLGVVMMADSEDSEGAITNPTGATLVDDIWYTVWDGEAIVRGPSSATLTSITIPASVTIDGTSYPVTGIAGVSSSTGTGAFMDMLQLTAVTLPYTLESFNAQYNANTAGLTYSNAFGIYPSAQTRTSVLTTVNWDIPEGETLHLTSIGGQAFWNCNALTTFTIPDSVSYIGHNAFAGCSSYAITAWPSSLTTIGPSAFSGTLTALTSMPANITAVPNGLFNACANITQFTLHSGITSIGSNAFSKTGLTSFTIPDNVSTVGESAFSGCTSLQTLTFPSGLTEIPRRVCDGCTSLATVNLPAGVTSIGDYAFENCSSLHMALPSTLTTVGEFAFYGATSMELATLPSGITTVPQQAFNGAIGSRFVIPSSVTSIGQYAFGLPRSNGNVASNIEIIFDGIKGASTDTVTIGYGMFDKSGSSGASYPANTVMTIMLYGKTYKYSTQSYVYDYCFSQSSNVTFVFNVYSIDRISAGSNDTVNYFATYNGVEYTRTLRSGSNWNAYAVGLADDTVTSITIPNQFYYYGTGGPYCAVQGVKGSQTADGYGAFGGSTSLTSATLNYLGNMTYNPNGNNYNYANTFKDCINLATVSLSSGITSLPYGIFSGCTSLDFMSMPSTLKTFGAYSFEGCTSLTLSNINLIVNRADDYAFSGCTLLDPASFALGNSPSIGAYAFEGCENLTMGSGSLRNATIGEGAFSGCTALNVTSIDNTIVRDFALENCTALSSIVITDSSLGDGVFNLSLASEPTETERSLSLLFMSEVEYTPDTFTSEPVSESEQAYDRIYNIVDLGGNNFTPQSSGLPEGTQVSDTLTVNAMSMLQKTEQEAQHETVEDSSATSTILRTVPIFVILGIILGSVALFYQNRKTI